MRILGYIHTFNDEEVIDRSVRALLDQTRSVDKVILVDNASMDGTLDRTFSEHVRVIRHPENRGTAGAVITGFEYALEHGFDGLTPEFSGRRADHHRVGFYLFYNFIILPKCACTHHC